MKMTIRTLIGLTTLIVIGSLGLILNLRSRGGSVFQGMPADLPSARETFDKRVRALAPPGLPVDQLIGRLEREGFHVDPRQACAVRKDRIGHARRVWRITWELSGRKLLSIRPTMGVSAL